MKATARRKRLDILLVERGLADSTQKALSMILAGEVQVDGSRTAKAGEAIAADARIEIFGRVQKFASRGGFKLEGALEDFSVEPAGYICLDVGSSTGGFTDCLLQRGAKQIYSVDVNVGQLAWKLQQDPRVTQIECNAREIRPEDFPELVDLVVFDVSFISVCKVLAPATAIANPGADFLILVKPQFELPKKDVGPGGIVTDTALHEKAIGKVRRAADSAGLECLGARPSRLSGAEGNQEYFLHARKKPIE
jgi:23S rRNA (cytidine1920-2'-O)/16S rRNA (cytidine1409-2'-O)-methyltransferase